MFKKVRSARPQALWRAERTSVLEHDKGPRTPLTPFFNIPSGNSFETAFGQFRFRRPAKVYDEFTPECFGLVRLTSFLVDFPQFK